jgi:hypothetical protein
MGEERKVYKVLVGKPEGKRPLGRPRRMWEDGVRMDLREIGLGVWLGFDWLRTWTFASVLPAFHPRVWRYPLRTLTQA